MSSGRLGRSVRAVAMSPRELRTGDLCLRFPCGAGGNGGLGMSGQARRGCFSLATKER